MKNDRSIKPNPDANFTPTLGNYKDLQPFRFWCQKVLPLVYDDSLSYYELLCKVVDFLNKTMEDVGTLNDDVTKLHTAYTQLQNYVNNYFSTLDVQEEINNKLDEMSKNGELTELIGVYVQPFIEQQNNKISVLEKRMDTFTSLPNGSTSGDAELIDIRVPATGFNNGNTYPTAGDAVRGQVEYLLNILKNNINLVRDLPENTDLNELNDVGIYLWGANENILNAPDGFMTGFILNAKTTIYKKYQIAINQLTRQIYVRTGNPVWSDWIKPLYQDDINIIINSLMNEINKYEKIAVKYTSGNGVDKSTEKFDVYVPKRGLSELKYIHYVILHSVDDDERCDVWRIGYCYLSSLDFIDEKQITTTGEWEMAIKLLGKDDFIGGYMHGDEKQYNIKFFSNGVEFDKNVFSDIRYVDSFSFIQQSDMYDPAPPYLTYKVAEHYSLHEFNVKNEHQLEITQRIKWRMKLNFLTSYLAMFPIAKNMSSKYFGNYDFTLNETPPYIKLNDINEVRLNSQNENVSCVFGISEYPDFDDKQFLISDNGGTQYNKCYYIISDNNMTDTNKIWKSKTYYDVMFN